MKDYIEREAAIKGFTDMLQKPGDIYPTDITTMLNGIPAADVKPVVRSEWVDYPECLKYPNAYSDDHIVCSTCEECFSILDNDCERFNFCPHCGSYNGGDGDDQH